MSLGPNRSPASSSAAFRRAHWGAEIAGEKLRPIGSGTTSSVPMWEGTLMPEVTRRRTGELLRKLFEILKAAPEGLQAKEALECPRRRGSPHGLRIRRLRDGWAPFRQDRALCHGRLRQGRLDAEEQGPMDTDRDGMAGLSRAQRPRRLLRSRLKALPAMARGTTSR